MQTVPFPPHYQSIYINFDFSSFSLISCLPYIYVLHLKCYVLGLSNIIFEIYLKYIRYILSKKFAHLKKYSYLCTAFKELYILKLKAQMAE